MKKQPLQKNRRKAASQARSGRDELRQDVPLSPPIAASVMPWEMQKVPEPNKTWDSHSRRDPADLS